MAITVLSPYQVFFIDEHDKLWAVLKDNRCRFVKSVPAFSCFSAARDYICGVEFDGEETTVMGTTFGFGNDSCAPMFKQWGYFYYPALLETKTPFVAVLKADLLNTAGTADMIVYKKARKKYQPIYQLRAKVVPPVWSPKCKKLYYITAGGAFARVDEHGGELLAQMAALFCLNKDETEFAYYENDHITIVSMETGNTAKIIAFDVTALSFNQSGDTLFFASSKDGTHNIYAYDRNTREVALLMRAGAKINAMSY